MRGKKTQLNVYLQPSDYLQWIHPLNPLSEKRTKQKREHEFSLPISPVNLIVLYNQFFFSSWLCSLQNWVKNFKAISICYHLNVFTTLIYQLQIINYKKEYYICQGERENNSSLISKLIINGAEAWEIYKDRKEKVQAIRSTTRMLIFNT